MKKKFSAAFCLFRIAEKVIKDLFPFAFLQKIFGNGHTKVAYIFK